MLLMLDDSLIDYINNGDLTEEDHEALEKIFTSHKNKFHFVFGSRYILRFLASNENLSTFVKNESMKKYRRFTLLNNIVGVKKTHITVVPSNCSMNRVETNVKNEIFDFSIKSTKFIIPLNYFCNPTFLERVCLIAENSSDIDFYIELAKGLSRLHFNKSNVVFSRNAGGGGTTFKVLEDKVNDKNMVLTIVDSDKIHPNDEFGKTLRQVIRSYERMKKNSIIGLHILSVHEKENLMPPRMYGVINPKLVEKLLPWKRLYEDGNISHMYKFCDLKEGISAINYCSFYEGLFDERNGIVSSSHENCWGYDDEFIGTKNEFESLIQEVKNKKATNKFLLPPLGEKILNDFKLSEMYKKDKENLNSMNTSIQGSVNPHKKILENRIYEIENFQNKLNDFHKYYLNELSEHIQDWGFCYTEAI